MRYPVLSLLLLPVSTPALAHLETSPHVHTYDNAMWAVALMMAAVVVLGVFLNGA